MPPSGSYEPATLQRYLTPAQTAPAALPDRSPVSVAPASEDAYENFVFTDPVVFRSLDEDPSTVLVERRCTLSGYVSYIVEQWACSRVHPTFVITTYTGDPSHTTVAGVLKIPKDEQFWSPRLKVYFNAVAECHIRKRETPLGTIMATNLSSFPSSLTVIDVPEGDVRKYREDFVVNENLKRLGCSGRAGLNLKRPTPATEAKFYQLYRASERVPLFNVVIGLVKLCQIALNVFDKLGSEYIDGLLCDVTERAINDWWADIGMELFNIEPSDGILGPTTVSALLGTLIGARNRLQAWGAPVAKDAFDTESLKRGITSFQKTQKLERSRRLDRQTLDKLHRVTAKAASGETWAVPRAVKSTVAELGGKGGEMVMGIVGGRDKAGISEIETLDLDRFVQLVSGDRAKWLWHGKPRKSYTDPFRNDVGDEDIAYPKDAWTVRKRDTGSSFTPRPSLETEKSWKQLESPITADSKEQQLKYALKKSVSVKVSDARAGLGRFRDAVGLPNRRFQNYQQGRHSKEASLEIPPQRLTDHSPAKEEISIVTKADGEFPSTPLNKIPIISEAPTDLSAKSAQLSEPSQGPKAPKEKDTESQAPVSGESSQGPEHDTTTTVTRILRRPLSFTLPPVKHENSDERILPSRHMSFSAVEEPMLPWKSIDSEDPPSDTLVNNILREEILTNDQRRLATKIADLDVNICGWVEGHVVAVEDIEKNAESRLKELNSAFESKQAEHLALQTSSTELISKENEHLFERTKRLETMGAKLDYELHSLQSKVEEVESGLEDYEHNIKGLEDRLQELLRAERKPGISWLEWGQRLFSRGTQ